MEEIRLGYPTTDQREGEEEEMTDLALRKKNRGEKESLIHCMWSFQGTQA